MTTVASPTIGVELNAGLSQLLWVTSGSMLAYAAVLIPAGKLGDRFGHRRVFFTGIVGFALSSVMVGLAQNVEMLIALRVVQGVFGASLLPSALAIIRLVFPPDRIKVAVGVFVGTFALSAASGPALGGLIVGYFDWRWVFFINVIVGAIVILLAAVLVPPVPHADSHRPLDLPGIGLLAVALAALVLGINQTGSGGWGGVVPVTCLVVTVLVGALLVLRERSAAEPLLPSSMFASRTFITGNLLILFATGLTFAVWFYLSLFLQNVQGASPLETDLQLLPMPAAGIIAAPLGGMLNQKLGARFPLAAGIVLCLVSFHGLTMISPDSGYGSIWPFLVALGASSAFIVPTGTEAVISSADRSLAGVASGFTETMSSLGVAASVASLGTAMTLVVGDDLADRLTTAGIPAATADQVAARADLTAPGIAPPTPSTSDTVAAAITRTTHDAFAYGFHTVLAAAMIVLVVILPLIWLIRPSSGSELGAVGVAAVAAAVDAASVRVPAHDRVPSDVSSVRG